MTPAAEAVKRFAADLDALVPPGERVGVAVSGGPDSLALLLLAAAARPGLIEAATVDHGLRPESGAEAEMVASICAKLDVPHAILAADWSEPPTANIQAEARTMRYRLLADWAEQQGLPGAGDRSPRRRPGRNPADAPRTGAPGSGASAAPAPGGS